MNSLVKVFSNFKEFYSEINGATLTGAIDVVVVEQADGSFICSPFHVRFGKLGVLRSREKVVDIEVNGEPVDIHMKLGESGEAFFVEECPEDDLKLLPANLVTSPIPPEFSMYDEPSKDYNGDAGDESSLVVPRRNSITVSSANNEIERKFENQVSDMRQRRNTTDETMHRRNLSAGRNELTTQQIRQEWAEHEQEQLLSGSQTSINWMSAAETISIDSLAAKVTSSQGENLPTDGDNTPTDIQNEVAPLELLKEESVLPSKCDIRCDDKKKLPKSSSAPSSVATAEFAGAVKEESKSKKKRRKKSQLKKKANQLNVANIGVASSVSIPEACNETEADQSSASVSKTTDTTDTNEATHSSDSSLPKEDDSATTDAPKACNNQFTPNQIADFHFFSDGEVGTSPRESRPSTPIKSDSEFEMTHWNSKADTRVNNSASWKWGELPTPAVMEESNDSISDEAKQAQARHSMISNMFDFMRQSKKMRNKSEGMYLSELEAEGLDPEVEALYFPQNSTMNRITPEDHESGNGTSVPHSPSSIESAAPVQMSLDSDFDEGRSEEGKLTEKSDIALSLCGGLERGGPSDLEFNQNAIQYSDVCQSPSIFSSPALVVRINGKYYNWETACPIVFTSLTYQKPLSTDAIDKLLKSTKNTPSEEQPPSAIGMKNDGTNKNDRGYSWWYWRKSGGKRGDDPDVKNNSVNNEQQPKDQQQQSPNVTMSTDKSMDDVCEKYRKSLRLTSEQIESLNLQEGMNEVEFSVTTAYQGTSRCKCYIFRWKHDDKVVISDIDGTITKSDVLGHILPMVGKDWAQWGVAQLFTKIEENGYKLLYLSARAIGQSRATREYLQSICQGDVKLPDGPLLLNPTSLISAFHREVIERKPEQFKIACLSDIQALFPQNPFYAGYGNRINDVWAYRAVGIPIMRIFTINPKGELKHELTQTLKSTYSSMTYIADQMFPPVHGADVSVEFSNVNFWREPFPEIDHSMLISVSGDGDVPLPVGSSSPKQ